MSEKAEGGKHASGTGYELVPISAVAASSAEAAAAAT